MGRRSAFTYEPLASPSTQIRLLELFPGRGEIKGRFRTVVLAEAQKTYEPISYCWQKDTKWQLHESVPIIVDGAVIFISESLHDALKRIRLPNGDDGCRTIWADAICINQGDPSEKSCQIPLMRDIYRSGRQTLLWLGKSNILTGLAFRYIRNWHRQAARNELSLNRGDENAVLYVVLVRLGIFERKYFTRGWIVQEIVVSERVSVMCGSHIMDWDDLYQAVDARRQHFASALNFGSAGFFYQVQTLRMNQPGTQTLVEVMADLSRTQITVPQDKIYSVLGLVPEHLMSKVPITPDTTKGSNEVFHDFTKRTLLARDSLTVLSMSHGACQQPKSSQLEGILPSWVWNPEPGFPFNRPSQKKGCCSFKATRGSKSNAVLEDNLLGLNGYLLGPVDAVSLVYDENGDSIHYNSYGPEDLLHMAQCYLSWRSVAGLDDSAGAKVMERRRYVFRRTLEPFASIHEEKCNAEETGEEALDSGQAVQSLSMRHKRKTEAFAEVDHEFLARFKNQVAISKRTPMAWALMRVWATGFKCMWDQRTDPMARAVWDLPQKLYWARGRCLVRADGGLVGLCPKETQIGDKVALLQGSQVPWILRPVDDQFILVGECFFHDVMWGQLWDHSRCRMLRIR